MLVIDWGAEGGLHVFCAVGDHDVTVVQEPVDHADGGGVLGQ
jgi:hypothetical protein